MNTSEFGYTRTMGRSKATTVSRKLEKKKYQHKLPPSKGGVYEIGKLLLFVYVHLSIFVIFVKCRLHFITEGGKKLRKRTKTDHVQNLL